MWGRVNVSVNVNGKPSFGINHSACPVILSKLGQKKRGELSCAGLKSEFKICNACRSASKCNVCDFFDKIKIQNIEVVDDTVFYVSFSMPIELVDKVLIESK